MIVDVLGLGESLDLHDGDNITFGVNDIFAKKPVDYLVCVDHKYKFTPQRLKTIENSRPKLFFSQLDEWSRQPGYSRIKIQQFFPGKIAFIDSQKLPKSCFSPYIAVGLAWQMFKPKKIRLFGVDMTDHKHLKSEHVRIKKHWQAMEAALKVKNCAVEIAGNGLLKNNISR